MKSIGSLARDPAPGRGRMAAECILIVDDNGKNLKLARVILAGEGYDVKTAGDAEEALRVLQSHTPRLILKDLQMPGMDGHELTHRLTADPCLPGLIIGAITAYAMKANAEEAFATDGK